MIGITHRQYVVSDPSDVGDLRRAVKDLALSNGIGLQVIGRAELISTEMTTNLLKYCEGGGEVLLACLQTDGVAGLEIICLDRGPGMSNPERMLQDGISTTGTLGGGLGAIKRLSDEFDLHSKPGGGTAIMSRLWTQPLNKTNRDDHADIGGVTVPLPGEEVSGDRWAVRKSGGTITIFLVDGLGHGPKAAHAATQSVQAFLESGLCRPEDLLRSIHEAIQHTQGAAAAIAELNPEKGIVTYSGVGNISGRIYIDGVARSCVSLPGCLGFQLHKIQAFSYPWSHDAVLLMNSDGLTSSLSGARLTANRASLIAGVLYRDYRRGNDDAMVVVARGVKAL
jgi:anti-sigma regulatory factor (Ser/Thr protein kinase)